MQLRVDRHRDEARPPAAEQRFDVFGGVARDDRHALAFDKPRGIKRARDVRGATRERRVIAHDAIRQRRGPPIEASVAPARASSAATLPDGGTSSICRRSVARALRPLQ